MLGRLPHPPSSKDMSESLNTLPLRQRRPPRISTDIPLFVRYSSDSPSSSPSPTSRTFTPGTTPSTGTPQCFFHVLCMYDFESSDPDHLPFHKDEVLTIIKQEESGWWAAMRPQGDRIGWIPSTFVLPVDTSKIAEHPDEAMALWPYESLNDPPLSAVHDPWVPVSEDYAALSFRLATPTDLVLYKGFFDDRVRNYSYEALFSPPNDERSSDMEVCIPPTPESPAPHRIWRSHPPSPLPSESGAQLIRPASSPLLDAVSRHLVGSDESTSDLTSSLDTADIFLAPKSVAASSSQVGIDSEDGIDANGQSQCFGFPADLRPASGPGQGILNTKLLDLTVWGPDNLAEQLCVLVHTLYATIRKNDCLDWMKGRRGTDVTGLRHFLDSHDYIASWVQKSIVAYNDMTRQIETLDFWIRVAEKCHALRNFDSLCAIILAVSGSLSPPGSAWERCTHKKTFTALHDVLDVANKFCCFMDTMDAAKGPSVPSVRIYLDHIRELHVKHPNNPPHHADAGSSAALRRMRLPAVSTLLRHQSSPYDFEITESVRSFIDDELQTVRLANDWPLARSCDIWEQSR
ncbi:ras GEF [Imleria badia]|nr:ras GEF [Imleria badia]